MVNVGKREIKKKKNNTQNRIFFFTCAKKNRNREKTQIKTVEIIQKLSPLIKSTESRINDNIASPPSLLPANQQQNANDVSANHSIDTGKQENSTTHSGLQRQDSDIHPGSYDSYDSKSRNQSIRWDFDDPKSATNINFKDGGGKNNDSNSDDKNKKNQSKSSTDDNNSNSNSENNNKQSENINNMTANHVNSSNNKSKTSPKNNNETLSSSPPQQQQKNDSKLTNNMNTKENDSKPSVTLDANTSNELIPKNTPKMKKKKSSKVKGSADVGSPRHSGHKKKHKNKSLMNDPSGNSGAGGGSGGGGGGKTGKSSKKRHSNKGKSNLKKIGKVKRRNSSSADQSVPVTPEITVFFFITVCGLCWLCVCVL